MPDATTGSRIQKMIPNGMPDATTGSTIPKTIPNGMPDATTGSKIPETIPKGWSATNSGSFRGLLIQKGPPTTLLGLFLGFLIQLIWSRAIQGAGLAQVRKSRGDRRRKSPLYDLQWRRTPSQNLTGAILRQTGAVNPPLQDWDSVQNPVARGKNDGTDDKSTATGLG